MARFFVIRRTPARPARDTLLPMRASSARLRRVRVRSFTSLVALGLAASCAGSTASRPAPALIPAARAAPAPAIAVHLLSGEPWSASSAAGRVLVLDVWATYCAPCRKAFPKLGKLAAAYPDAVVVGLSVDEDDGVVRRFLAEVPAEFSIARDPALTVQSGPLALQSVPSLVVVDRRGRMRIRNEQPTDADYDALPAQVAALLAE
jgi:cytochrome c biogenesis protein CcmG/thiol:disulfide interchange protein DsbE